jgi:glycosyltransferase involved in cell wall biosynthesis
VLVVGHLNRYKFAAEMFAVVEALTRKGRAVQVVFCGDGPLRAEGERRLGRTAIFAGWQPNADVLALARGAAAVLVPMSGFVLLEAAWLGAPVITSHLEWHTEIVQDGVTGWVIDPAQTIDWAERIEWILDRPAEAADVGARLRQAFLDRYTPDRALAEEIALYRRLLAA